MRAEAVTAKDSLENMFSIARQEDAFRRLDGRTQDWFCLSLERCIQARTSHRQE